MTLLFVGNILASLLAMAFFILGVLHLSGPLFLRVAYRRWQYAGSFRYVAGAAQLFAALLLAIPQTRIWGGILAGIVLFVTVVTLLNHRQYVFAIPAILAMVALAPAII
jgi:hypothetical protein